MVLSQLEKTVSNPIDDFTTANSLKSSGADYEYI